MGHDDLVLDPHLPDVAVLVAGRDIRVLTDTGQLIRALTLDPTRDYQPQP